jgi:hypothetical protein
VREAKRVGGAAGKAMISHRKSASISLTARAKDHRRFAAQGVFGSARFALNLNDRRPKCAVFDRTYRGRSQAFDDPIACGKLDPAHDRQRNENKDSVQEQQEAGERLLGN